MKRIIFIILLSYIFISLFLLCGCSTIAVGNIENDIKDISEKSIFLKENLDFKKEVLFTATGMADYAVAPPKDDKELYETSKNVVSGKAVASELCIDKESGFTYTLVKFQKENLIKGDMKSKEFTVAYIGGYMSGEKYIEIHPDYKMSIIKGANENEVKEGLKNKIIKVGGMPGEEIPRVGKSYLLFLAPHNLEIEGVEYYYMVGYEFAQGLFEINYGRVRDFSPEAREAAFYKAMNSKSTDSELLESMHKATLEVDIDDFINAIKD